MRTSEASSALFDLSTVRGTAADPEAMARTLKDRALKVIEGAQFPDEGSREDYQSRVASLLERFDTPDAQIALRILKTGSPTYMRAFGKAITEQPLMNEERTALAVGSDAQGGYAVPFTLDPTVILTNAGAANPIRQMARVETIVTDKWQGVTSAGITAAYSGSSGNPTGEGAEADDDAPTFGQPELTVVRADVFVPFSIEISQDWAALRGELTRMVADAKDRLEATTFVSGSGTNGVPQGVLTGLTGSQEVPTAGANAFAEADLYALSDALPERFQDNAQFLAHRAIYNKVRQFDDAGGSALWVQLADGLPPQLIGYPARRTSAMDSTVTEGDEILLIGDFRHYLIVDRIGMSVELIPHLFGENRRPTGQRGVFVYWRNTAEVLVPGAFRVLVVAGAGS
jgi:HK97 family phage major capsid protein